MYFEVHGLVMEIVFGVCASCSCRGLGKQKVQEKLLGVVAIETTIRGTFSIFSFVS